MSIQQVPLALVHHANQSLITDGYENREGLTAIVDRFASLLAVHERRSVPLNLHISGTFLEAILWHQPRFLKRIRQLRKQGLLSLIGGAYSQNIMPVSSAEQNRRQLRELLWLYDECLDCPPASVKIAWIPERVWDTEALAPILGDPSLPNGGYRALLLDDRILSPLQGAYEDSPRARFDSEGAAPIVPWSRHHDNAAPARHWNAESTQAYPIEGGHGLALIPIVAGLRYAVPPSCQEHWRYLNALVEQAGRHATPRTLLVYADDMEKAAGLGAWAPGALSQYEEFVDWLAEQPNLTPTLLSEWLERGLVDKRARSIEPGTFFELAHLWGAGEDYLGWWSRPGWRRYRKFFETSEAALRAAESSGADAQLLELGWKQLLAACYETGWYDVPRGAREPALWSQALASHARASLVIAEAARWHSRREPTCSTQVRDLDQDGEAELVLKHDRLFAVVSLTRGGRIIYLFELAEAGGRLVIGNPADDWHWQQELNRYMDHPPNHPGALADVGFEHDVYEIATCEQMSGSAVVELRNVQPGSPIAGSRKRLALLAGEPCLGVCYRLIGQPAEFSTECCLSPDYLRLLRYGRNGLEQLTGAGWRGWRNRSSCVWVGVDPSQGSRWEPPKQQEAGHGLNLRVTASAAHLHLVIGTGTPSAAIIRRCLDALHPER